MKRLKKNRIDRFYMEIDRISRAVEDASTTELLDLRRQMEVLRRRAFRDLIYEKLEAKESFTIFQDFMRAELKVIDDRLTRVECQD